MISVPFVYQIYKGEKGLRQNVVCQDPPLVLPPKGCVYHEVDLVLGTKNLV